MFHVYMCCMYESQGREGQFFPMYKQGNCHVTAKKKIYLGKRYIFHFFGLVWTEEPSPPINTWKSVSIFNFNLTLFHYQITLHVFSKGWSLSLITGTEVILSNNQTILSSVQVYQVLYITCMYVCVHLYTCVNKLIQTPQNFALCDLSDKKQ